MPRHHPLTATRIAPRHPASRTRRVVPQNHLLADVIGSAADA